ncbi:MAG: RsmB/NOP family class I SAM-dependent RNA methyltransferase, partial [Acidimicrobiia bacterium]
ALGPPWPWPEGDDADAVAVRTSHPRWIVDVLTTQLGAADALATLELNNQAPAVTLRPNRLRTTPADLAAELTCAGAEVEAGALVPEAVLVRGIGDPGRLPAVAEGRATPQDQASQAVVAAVGAQPGETIGDMAAAPGGKATGLAEAMGDDGTVVASDLRAGRARLVTAAARRLGLGSVLTVVAEGRALPFGPGRFVRVLLDAPCSGLGVLRRRPEARWRVDQDDVDRLAALQRELLTAAVAATRPGGLIAYAVCTLTAAETLDVDAWAAQRWPDLRAEPPPGPPWRPHGRGALLAPHAAGTDGMYLLLLRT